MTTFDAGTVKHIALHNFTVQFFAFSITSESCSIMHRLNLMAQNMVEKILQKERKIDLGLIHIGADELIKYLTEISDSPETIIVENGDYRLRGIDDIKKYRNLLHGNPTIIMGNIRIYFDSYGSTVNFDGHRNESDTGAIDSIANFLKIYMNKYVKYLSFLAISAVIILTTINFVLKEKISQLNLELFIAFLNISAIIIFFYAFLTPFHWVSVTYNPKDSFYKRNKDKIYFLAIGAVVSLVIKITYDYFTKWNSP